MSKPTIIAITIAILVLLIASIWLPFGSETRVSQGVNSSDILIANRKADATEDHGDLPNCQDKWKHILKNPLSIFRFTCIYRDHGAERIRQDHVGLPEVISILATADEDSISLRLSALRKHLEKPEISGFIIDLWRGNKKKYPQLPWRLLEKPSRRIDVAAMMNVVDPAGARTYFDFVAEQAQHGDRAARSDAAAALRFFDNDEAISALERLIRRDEYFVAYNAVQALATLRSPSALAALEQLQHDTSIGDEIRVLIDQQISEIQKRVPSSDCPVKSVGLVAPSWNEKFNDKILQEEDLNTLFNKKGFDEILHILNGMSFHIYDPRYKIFLNDVWNRNIERHPNFNWACLDHPFLRVTLAGLLATAEGDRNITYLAHLRGAAVAKDDEVRFNAIVQLGNVGTQSDIDLLVAAIRNDLLAIAKIAAISLRGMAGEAGVSALEGLERDSELATERKRIVAEVLKGRFPANP